MTRQRRNRTADDANTPHVAVMAREVVEVLAVHDGGIYVDGTFGAGGYSRMMLQSAHCTVVAIDRDPAVAPIAQSLGREFPDRLHLLSASFGDLAELLPQAGFAMADGVTFDLGVSSMQLDQGERGFSFQKDGPLDMRMGDSGPSAADAVNNLTAEQLADIFSPMARSAVRASLPGLSSRRASRSRSSARCNWRELWRARLAVRLRPAGNIPQPAPFRRCASM